MIHQHKDSMSVAPHERLLADACTGVPGCRAAVEGGVAELTCGARVPRWQTGCLFAFIFWKEGKLFFLFFFSFSFLSLFSFFLFPSKAGLVGRACGWLLGKVGLVTRAGGWLLGMKLGTSREPLLREGGSQELLTNITLNSPLGSRQTWWSCNPNTKSENKVMQYCVIKWTEREIGSSQVCWPWCESEVEWMCQVLNIHIKIKEQPWYRSGRRDFSLNNPSRFSLSILSLKRKLLCSPQSVSKQKSRYSRKTLA